MHMRNRDINFPGYSYIFDTVGSSLINLYLAMKSIGSNKCRAPSQPINYLNFPLPASFRDDISGTLNGFSSEEHSALYPSHSPNTRLEKSGNTMPDLKRGEQ